MSILLDLSFAALIVTIVFAARYLGKLHRNGYGYGEFLAFSVLVVPMAVAWNAIGIIGAGIDRIEWVNSWFNLVAGLLGIAVCIPLVLLPGGRAKTLMWPVACGLLLVAIAGANHPWNPLATLSAVVVGFAIYRIEWKRMLYSSETSSGGTGTQALNPVQFATDHLRQRLRRRRIRVAAIGWLIFLCIAGLLVVVGPVSQLAGALPAEAAALAALAIAAVGSVAVGLVWRSERGNQAAIELAAATFALLLAVASTFHLIAMPSVEGLLGSVSTVAQYWKPVLSGYALIGAVLVFASTASGLLLQVRPFATVLILPAAILLPDDSFFFLEFSLMYRDWVQTAIEAGITGAVLWAMWYAFGPGRARNDESAPDTNDTPAAEQAPSEV